MGARFACPYAVRVKEFGISLLEGRDGLSRAGFRPRGDGAENRRITFMAQGYTPEFWSRAIELTMRRPKQCEDCRVIDGENINREDRPKRKTIAVVRVALRKPSILDRANLGLFCTRCRRGKYELRLRRSDLEKLILPLFGEP